MSQGSPLSPSTASMAGFADLVRASVAAGEIAGAAAAVATRRSLRMEAFGRRDLATGAPVELDTIFRMGSTAKTMFTAAALILLEDRRIDLGQDVCKWLPELSDRRVLRTPDSEIDDTTAARRRITIYDVLTFQLGIGIYLRPRDTPILRAMAAAGIAPAPEPVPWGPDEFMARLGALPLAHQPGETFMYHTGDDVLRVLISRIADRPLYQVLQERLFEPMSMADTGCRVPKSKLRRFSTCYFPQKQPGQDLEPWDHANGRFVQEPIFPNQLMSTVVDFTKFTHMLLNGGEFQGRRILKTESVSLMLRDHLSAGQKALSPAPDGFWETRGWGMGASVYTRSIPQGPKAGSYSWFGGYGPHFIVDKARGSTVILMLPRVVQGPAQTELGYAFELATYRDVLSDESC